jgi:hypothetical protein
MAALDTVGITTFEAIRLRFPRAAKNRVRGTGPYLLILKCCAIWTFLAFPTAAERDAAWEQWQNRKCGDMHCAFDHQKWNLNAG